MAETLPASLIGLNVSGDCDGLTIYTDRFGKKVWYPKAPPDCPPSDLQITQRERFRLAQADWSASSLAVIELWELLVDRASLSMTGQNLWIHFSLMKDNDALATLVRQTGVTVTAPPWH